MFPNIYRLKKIRKNEKFEKFEKSENFAGINFRRRRILKNFAELTFAEKAKKRETAKVSDLKVYHHFGVKKKKNKNNIGDNKTDQSCPQKQSPKMLCRKMILATEHLHKKV